MDETQRAARAPRQRRGTDPLLGRVINERYKILSVIAHGGMGRVYRAEQAPLGRLVALKVMSPHYNGDHDPEFHKRFFLEASIASKLKHPNTVTIFDYGKTDDDVFYIAMELLEGRTLHRLLRDEGPLGAERTVHIAIQICCSLREAHALGVVHRDLKPANVYVVKHGDEGEFVKVLDFGLVKNVEEKGEQQTQAVLFLGSPKYMAPEQIAGGPIDPRADIYALGVMIYEMLAGKVPFDSVNSVNILMAHVHEPIPSLRAQNPKAQAPAALEDVLRKCMAKSAEDRFHSMNEVLLALKQSVGMVSSDFGPPLPPASSVRPVENLRSAPANSQQATPFARLATPTSSLAPLLLAALFALGSAAAFVAFALRPNEPAPNPEPREASEREPEEPAAAPAQVEPSVIISLRSAPPGAMVVVGDREYGPTPTELEWTGPEALPGRQLTFRFRRTGYRALTITREIHGPRLDVEATFQDPHERHPR